MAATDPDASVDAAIVPQRRRRGRGLAAAAGLAGLVLALIWAERVDIADRFILGKIHQLKLSARYRLDEIGPGREVLGDISVGDPANPDLVIKRLEIDTDWRGGLPAITRLDLVGTRLRGRWANGRLSFGSLDRVIFAPTPVPFRLPDIALSLRDAVATIAGDHGAIGMAIAGSGNLRNGFVATTVAVAPSLRIAGCEARAANLHGRIAIQAEQPRLIGPLRMAELACPGAKLAVQAPLLQLDLRSAATFDGGTARLGLTTGAAKLGTQGAARLTGSGGAGLRSGVLTGNVALAGERVYAASLNAAQIGAAGHFRVARQAGGTWRADGTLSGRQIALAPTALATLARAQAASADTMAGPLLAALRDGLARESAADRLSGSWTAQGSAGGTSLHLSDLHLDGARTGRWLALSDASLQQASGAAGLVMAGRFAVSGRGFPQLRGQIEPLAGGGGTAMLAMPSWAAAMTSLAIPVLALRWTRSGGVGFDGSAVLSGPVPGGRVAGLTIPLQGSWSAGEGWLMGQRCRPVGFDRLTLGSVDLVPASPVPGAALTVCPGPASRAMVTLDARGTHLAVATTGLALQGRTSGSRLTIGTGAAALTSRGVLTVNDIAVAMTAAAPSVGGTEAGPRVPAAQLHLAQFAANLGAVTSGQFRGGDIRLAVSPAAVRAASGAFTWDHGQLAVKAAQFRLEDPAPHPLFAPIIAQDVTLAMANGAITGAAVLRATAANRELATMRLVHDLGSGTGHADLAMPGLVFDKAFQPKQLSALSEGVIADASGTLTGGGRIDWDHGHVTSSGTIATNGFDFAAAFGPVKGVAGRLVFTDLLGLVTAPDQQLAIATINPGIEVDGGILTFALQRGGVVAVKRAIWPFLDGQLTLLPTRLVLGATEQRRFELRVDGLNAAKFLARMDLANLAATGTFDGNLPLVFDDSGGRIEKGLLLSRPPGGTVSYVGALTYKNLSPMANYAFQALRALRYRQMRIAMDGALAGDIVTRVSMQGVGQGKGAKRNFITNQIARLPIRFDVTITAPFMQLITSFRSFYDPAMVADPRVLGLINAQGRPVAHPPSDRLPAAQTPAVPPPPAIQP